MSPVNLNPISPSYPYSGGTDNPGDDTSKAGGGVMVESGPLSGPPGSFNNANPRHPSIVAGISQAGTDTVLPAGFQAVPADGTGFSPSSDYGNIRSADPAGGVFTGTGVVLESEQDETAGETETSPDAGPAAFPEPNP